MSTRPVEKFKGSCHCEAVRFEIETDFPELTTCDCSICRKKNALMVKVHESRFKLTAGEKALTEYRFHTNTARHFLCKICGIYPFHRKRLAPDSYGINCSIPCDHIPRRSWPLFRARDLLRGVIESFQREQMQ